MPFMGGMEATELIRSYEMHRGLPPTPIIALTAHASTFPFLSLLLSTPHILTISLSTVIGDRERCLQAGMDDHITKPLRRGDLLNAINKLAGGGKKETHHLMRRPPPIAQVAYT